MLLLSLLILLRLLLLSLLLLSLLILIIIMILLLLLGVASSVLLWSWPHAGVAHSVYSFIWLCNSGRLQSRCRACSTWLVKVNVHLCIGTSAAALGMRHLSRANAARLQNNNHTTLSQKLKGAPHRLVPIAARAEACGNHISD